MIRTLRLGVYWTRKDISLLKVVIPVPFLAPYSPKAQHYWDLAIWLFGVVSRTLIGWDPTPLQRCSQCILQPQLNDQTMIRTLRLGVYWTRKDISLLKVVIPVTFLAWVRLAKVTIVHGLFLNIAHMVLGWIFSILLSDYKSLGLISILTSPMVSLTGFFHADDVTNVHLLSGSWYFSSRPWHLKEIILNKIYCTQLYGSWLFVFYGI